MFNVKKYRFFTFALLFAGAFVASTIPLSQPVAAAPGEVNPDASVARVNRMTLLMGNTYFYDGKTTDDDWTFHSVGLECAAEIKYTPALNGGRAGSIPESWVLNYTKKLESGSGCGPKNTKKLSKPSNWSERLYTVFAGGESDGKIISVKPDSNVTFTKKGTYNGNTVYIQDGVDPYSCPLVIRKNTNWVLIPLQEKSSEEDVSNQIRSVFEAELKVGDTACGPTDNDELGIFEQFGLPESYYNAGAKKDHYLATDFGFDGKEVGGADLGGSSIPSIAAGAGIALNGPLKGGGYTGSDSTVGGGGTGSFGDGDGEGTTCAVDGIGWIVCPVVTFLSKLNDAAFGFLNDFLNVPPDIFSDPATKNAWEAFRNIANIAFVIAFLVIIYSQMTGAGVTNYGLKKLLPKLIIAAILVNVSYYICAIMIDLSNILGAALYDIIKGINIGADTGAGGAGSTVWATAGAVILGIGAAVGLLALIIFAPTSLLAFALVIMILIARQAFVVLLIVVSPLAFVAYLLPNTEQWFKKWWKALVAMLMVFPIIALVFGASSLASDILLRVSEDGAGGGDDNQLMKIIAAAVLAIPLFAVPLLLKGAMSAAGTVGARLGGLQDKANRFGGKSIKNSRIGEAKTAFDARRQSKRLNRRVGSGRLGRMNQAIDRSKFGRLIGGDRGAAAATSAVHHEFDEEVKRQKTLLSGRSNDSLLQDLQNGKGSEEYQAAVAGTLMSRSHRESHLKALEVMRSRNQQAEATGDHKAMDVVGSIQKQMSADMRDKPWALGDQAAGQMVEGTYGRSVSGTGEAQTHFTSNIQQQLQDRVGTKLSAQTLATMNPDEMNRIHAAAINGDLTPEQLTQLRATIASVRSNKQMEALVKPEAQAQFDQILSDAPEMGAARSHNNAATQQEAIDINERRDATARNQDGGSLF